MARRTNTAMTLGWLLWWHVPPLLLPLCPLVQRLSERRCWSGQTSDESYRPSSSSDPLKRMRQMRHSARRQSYQRNSSWPVWSSQVLCAVSSHRGLTSVMLTGRFSAPWLAEISILYASSRVCRRSAMTFDQQAFAKDTNSLNLSESVTPEEDV